jgi:hypothetical protein
MSEPDFYLASTEGYGLEEPHRCWRLKRLATSQRDDLLLVRIDPPLPGQKYGLGNRDIEMVLVAPRHHGTSLFPIAAWPVYVHVARPLVEAPQLRQSLGSEELEEIAWAELYKTENDARMKVM